MGIFLPNIPVFVFSAGYWNSVFLPELIIFSIADGYHFSIEIFKKFGELFFRIFYHICDFYIIKCTNDSTAVNTLNQAKFLTLLSRYMHSLKLMMFTGRTF